MDSFKNKKNLFTNKMLIACCDLCPSMGYSGDLFYIGKSDFTGPFLNPHICPKCFKEKGEMFFKYFKDITGYPVILTETILDETKINNNNIDNCDMKNASIKIMKDLSITSPYLQNGSYNNGWYFTCLKELVEYLNNDRIRGLLIEGDILSIQMNY